MHAESEDWGISECVGGLEGVRVTCRVQRVWGRVGDGMS